MQKKRPLHEQVLHQFSKPFPDGLNINEHLIAGFVATAAAVFAMHPMDTIKTFIQRTRPAGTATAAGGSNSLNIFSASAEILSRFGPLAFYKGVGPNLVGQAPAGAIKFAVFEGLSHWAEDSLFATKKLSRNMRPVIDFTCAALAFCACSIVLLPGEVLKQKLQAGVYPNFRQACRAIWENEGVRGFYTGFTATLVRDVPYTMCEFGFYHQFKRILKLFIHREKLTGQEEVFMGGLAGGVTGFLTVPLDLAKTKIMTQGADVAASQRYTNFLQVLREIAKTEGLPGLFKGGAARVIWLIPFTAVYFGVHEQSKRALLNRKRQKSALINIDLTRPQLSLL